MIALEKTAAAAGNATQNERPQLSSDGANEASGNSESHSNDQEQEEESFNLVDQHHAHQEQKNMPQEQRELDKKPQNFHISIQGARTELGCKFCSTIVSSFKSVLFPEQYGTERRFSLGQWGELLSSSCPHTTWLQNLEFRPGSDPLWATRAIYVSHGPETRTWASFCTGYKTNLHTTFYPTAAFELMRRPEIPDHQGRGRIMDENWIDLELVRDWRSRCIVEHNGRCDKPAFGSRASFRPSWLIDVVEGCIVPCEAECPRFFTLSYTWGKTKNFLTKKHNINNVRKPGALLTGHIAENIPETIRNAIALTKALGETRLWVDSLCIIQDDEVALLQDLRQMHRIYASSFLTIIAEDGQDADFGLRGLRGLSAPRVADQKVLPMAAGERLLMIGKERKNHQVSNYDYSERMWTFQERIYAKRRLIFTSLGLVKWQCNCAEWEEHLHYSSEHEEKLDDEEVDVASALKSRIPCGSTAAAVVRDFNQKSLTCDEDVLDAFSGIQTHLESIFPSKFLFGHPEFFFDISLCWFTRVNLRRRTVSDKFTGDPIHDGLPSWSWMGWQGLTFFPKDCEHEPGFFGFTKSVTKWYCVELPPSSLSRPIDCRWQEFRANAAERQVDMDGWTCVEFEPPSRWNGFEPDKIHLTPGFMPKQLPKRLYHRHGLENATWKDLRWYPVPVQSEDVTGEEHGLQRPLQFQLIRCETTRAFLMGSTEDCLDEWEDDDPNPSHPLLDDTGNAVGALMLHHVQDHLLFKEGRKVELVAIVKGWTDLPSIGSQLTREGGPWMEEWERRRQEKDDCIFVLWITWNGNIAYRKAFGFVLSEDWERLREPENVDLILG